MSKPQQEAHSQPQTIRVTAAVSLRAYNAITEIQRLHRTKTGRALPLREVLDTAILAYAKQQRIQGRG